MCGRIQIYVLSVICLGTTGERIPAAKHAGRRSTFDLEPLLRNYRACRIELFMPDMRNADSDLGNSITTEAMTNLPLILTSGSNPPKVKSETILAASATASVLAPFLIRYHCRATLVPMPAGSNASYFEIITRYIFGMRDTIMLKYEWNATMAAGKADFRFQRFKYTRNLYVFYMYSSEEGWGDRVPPSKFAFPVIRFDPSAPGLNPLPFLEYSRVIFIEMKTYRGVGHICMGKRTYLKEYPIGGNIATLSMGQLDEQYRREFISICAGLKFELVNPEEEECSAHSPLPYTVPFVKSQTVANIQHPFHNKTARSWRNFVLLSLLLDDLPNSTIYQAAFCKSNKSESRCSKSTEKIQNVNLDFSAHHDSTSPFAYLRSDSYVFLTCDGITRASPFTIFTKPYTFYSWLAILLTFGVLTLYINSVSGTRNFMEWLRGLCEVSLFVLCSNLLEQSASLSRRITRKGSRLYYWIFPTGLLMGLVITNAYKGVVTVDLIAPPLLVKFERIEDVLAANYTVYILNDAEFMSGYMFCSAVIFDSAFDCSELVMRFQWLYQTLRYGIGLSHDTKVPHITKLGDYNRFLKSLRPPEFKKFQNGSAPKPEILRCNQTAYLGTSTDIENTLLQLKLFESDGNWNIYKGKHTFLKKYSGIEFPNLWEDGGLIYRRLTSLIQGGIYKEWVTFFEEQERREYEMRVVGKYDKKSAKINKLKMDGSTKAVVIVLVGCLCACVLQFLYEHINAQFESRMPWLHSSRDTVRFLPKL